MATKSAFPPVSEAWNWKVWLVPLPAFGVTDTALTVAVEVVQLPIIASRCYRQSEYLACSKASRSPSSVLWRRHS